MSSKTKSVTAVLIVLALVAGVGMTKAGSKYKTQEKVNQIRLKKREKNLKNL